MLSPLRTRRLYVAAAFATIIALALSAVEFFGNLGSGDGVSSAHAQNSQNNSGNVEVKGDISGNLNNTNINIENFNMEMAKEVPLIKDDEQRNFAKELSVVIGDLARDGIISFNLSEKEVAENIIQKIRMAPLSRDFVDSRQFNIPENRAQYLLGGKNRIAFRFANAEEGYFYFNGEEIVLRNGEALSFEEGGTKCDLIFDGEGKDQKSADFTLNC